MTPSTIWGGDSIKKFQLEFLLEKSLGFGFPTLRKSSKVGQASESKWNLDLFFKPGFKSKIF